MAFDQQTRNRLQRFVSAARKKLSEEFTRQLQNVYGIDPASGLVTPLENLGGVTDSTRETARILRDTLAHYLATSPSEDKSAALDRIVREQAFTVLNRLAALRMAEARGLLIESLGNGYNSKGFQLYARLAGTGLGETGDAYRFYLFSVFDEFALDLKVLFDRFSPYGRMFPREPALLDLLTLINDPEIAPLWAEDETIGWIYQYFNSKEERKQMRDESSAPRNSRELAVRNQFFTPRYVVEFLTDNTIGRIWYEMTHGETRLKEQCRYLVRRPTEIFLEPGESPPEQLESLVENLSQEELLKQPLYIPHRPLKDPREIRILDPACGSMHFGLYAFDLLEVIYEEAWDLEASQGAGVPTRSSELQPFSESYMDKTAFLRDVPRLIVEHNIHGIDIDPRAVQIAGLSLWLRAQRAWQGQSVKASERTQIRRSNIVCAEPMPGEESLLEEFLAKHFSEMPEDRLLGQLVRRVFDEMKLAGEAGSLLKIEEEIAAAVVEAKEQWQVQPTAKQETLFVEMARPEQQPLMFETAGITDEMFWHEAEERIYAALKEYAEAAENGGYQKRLFVEDAARGFAFIDICRKRYDVVLMNPPFGEAAKISKPYIEAKYTYSSADILHAFVERGLGWLNLNGREGVISARTGFFLGDSKNWRKNVVFQNRLACFADLGLGVLDDALVEVAAYAIERGKPQDRQMFTNRQLDTREKEIGLLGATQATAGGNVGGFCLFDQSLLEVIPDHTLAYWAPASFLKRYAESGRFGEAVGRVRQGVATADDFRFARLGWEVANACIGRGKRWQRFSKGGEYSPIYDDVHLLVDWLNDGAQIAASSSSRFQNIACMFQPGACYPARTASAFAPKVLPSECVFSHMSQTWFAANLEQLLLSIGYLCCRVPQTFLELAVGSGDISTAGSAARRYTSAVVESVPAGVLRLLDTPDNMKVVRSLYLFRLAGFIRDEASCHFCNFYIASSGTSLRAAAEERYRTFVSATVQVLGQSAHLDQNVTEVFALSEEEKDFVNQEVGPHPTSYAGSASAVEVARLFHLSEEDLMKAAVSRHGSKRWFTKKSYFVDRRLEIICHLLAVPPSTIESLLSEQPMKIGLNEFTKSIVSESLGCTYGRWDIRFDTGEKPAQELPDPFAPLPVCPPGMLQNEQGLPAELKDVPDSYPLRISWQGILVDDQGHNEDIENRLQDALRVIWKDRADDIESEACEILGVRSLREYFRKPAAFFAEHLQRYSKSRRQAPIYWPLSTTSGSYTLWLYYHRLNDQTLYTCVVDYVEPKLRQVSETFNQLRGKAGNRSRAEEKEFEQLQDLELELQEYRDELLRLAKLPWKPNLNDGVQITAAPLWKLFRLPKWQKTLKETWQKLDKGDFDWAHLAMTIWPERVVPKCVKDRSLAIAHEVENLFWIEDETKWRNLRTPAEEIEEQKKRQRSTARERGKKLLTELATSNAANLSAEQVRIYLTNGDWDDREVALRLYPERMAEKCWLDPILARKLSLELPSKRTKAAGEKFVKKLVSEGCGDVGQQLERALKGSSQSFGEFWAELEAGKHDDLDVALPLWGDRVVDKCTMDVGLAERHGIHKFLWVQHPTETWRKREDPKVEVINEIARRRGANATYK